MDQMTTDMMNRIMDSERMGYAYLHPSGGGERQEYILSTTPENMANFIGSHFCDAEKIVVTDILDRLIVDTCGGFLNTCPDQDLCHEIISFLAPIQMGEKEAGELLVIGRQQAEEYFAAEDAAATMAEYGMSAACERSCTEQTGRRDGYVDKKGRYLLCGSAAGSRFGAGRHPAGADHSERYREPPQPHRDRGGNHRQTGKETASHPCQAGGRGKRAGTGVHGPAGTGTHH